jgi:peroxisome-assembly ATPase
LSSDTDQQLESLYKKVTKDKILEERTIIHQGRNIYVPEGTQDGVAKFEFRDLCCKPLGAGDYNVLSRSYHTIFVKNIPKMSLQEKTEAKRFIILIDTMYENKVKLICTADERPELLFSHDPTQLTASSSDRDMLDSLNIQSDSVTMFTGQEEVFQFARCVSRLKEMQSDGYLQSNRSHKLE